MTIDHQSSEEQTQLKCMRGSVLGIVDYLKIDELEGDSGSNKYSDRLKAFFLGNENDSNDDFEENNAPMWEVGVEDVKNQYNGKKRGILPILKEIQDDVDDMEFDGKDKFLESFEELRKDLSECVIDNNDYDAASSLLIDFVHHDLNNLYPNDTAKMPKSCKSLADLNEELIETVINK